MNSPDEKPPAQVHLITFADSRLMKAARRFRKQAKRFGEFSTVRIYSENQIDQQFLAANIDRLNSSTRGFGYWLWKPKVILDRLKELPDNEILFYADVGFHINIRGRERFGEWIDLFCSSEEKFLVFQAFPPVEPFVWDGRGLPDLADIHWCKRDVAVFLNMDNHPALMKPTIGAGLIGIKNSEHGRKFVAHWLRIITENPYLIDDSPSRSANHTLFREHRHDQAVFSLMAKKEKIGVRLSAFEYWYPLANGRGADWELLKKEPFLAKRDHRLKANRKRRTFLSFLNRIRVLPRHQSKK